MDSRWRDAFQGLADKLIAEDSEQLVTKHSAYFVCGNLILSILDTIEHIEQPRGKGMEHFPVPDDAEQTILPPQRSMTPEESANLAAYRKTKFKHVPAQHDELREEVPIIHGRAELAVHDDALRASVREECANAAMEAFGHNETNLPHSDGCIACAVKQAILALASEKAAPEEVAQAREELGVCNHFPQGPPHRRRNHSNNTNFPCVNWRPLPKGDVK